MSEPMDPIGNEGGRDRELGEALRRALGAEDSRRFAAGVLSRWDAARAPRPAWALLAGWARVGIAAALLVAVLLGWSVRNREEPGTALDAALSETLEEDAGVLLAGSGPPDADWLLGPLTAP